VNSANNPLAFNAVTSVDMSLGCFGVEVVEIHITTFGSEELKFSINGEEGPFQRDSNFTSLPTGSYNVVIWDTISQCTKIYDANPIEITQPTLLEITNVQTTDPTTCGVDDGTLIITPTIGGGTGDLEYSINNVDWFEDSTFLGLASGTYDAYVRDANLCWDDSTGNVISTLAGPVLDTIITDNSLCFGRDGKIRVIVTDWDPLKTYQYSIDAGDLQVDSIFTDLISGEYDILVEDELGCTSTLTDVPVEDPAGITGITTNSKPTLISDGDQETGEAYVTSVEGGTVAGEYHFMWDNDDATTGFGEDTITNLSVGNYNVTVTDDNNCTFEGGPIPVGTAMYNFEVVLFTGVTCESNNNGYALVETNGGDGDFDYLWENGENNDEAFELYGGYNYVTVTDIVKLDVLLNL